jgi:hypothetical protein
MATFIIIIKNLLLKTLLISPIRVSNYPAEIAEAADKYIVFFLRIPAISAGNSF